MSRPRTQPHADPNLTICTTCGALLPAVMHYHPYAYCLLVKAGLDPERVVADAAREYDKSGWPEAKTDV